MRRNYQDAMSNELTAIVEAVTAAMWSRFSATTTCVRTSPRGPNPCLMMRLMTTGRREAYVVTPGRRSRLIPDVAEASSGDTQPTRLPSA